jgi:hypothetical protein
MCSKARGEEEGILRLKHQNGIVFCGDFLQTLRERHGEMITEQSHDLLRKDPRVIELFHEVGSTQTSGSDHIEIVFVPIPQECLPYLETTKDPQSTHEMWFNMAQLHQDLLDEKKKNTQNVESCILSEYQRIRNLCTTVHLW